MPLPFLSDDSIMIEMSESFKLHRLQQIDSHLDQIHARLREIDRLLEDNRELVETQRQEMIASQELEATKKMLRRAEENVKANKLKIEQTEATLYGGKERNPKALQDLQHEVEALKRYQATLEDRLLEAMIAVEEAEARFAAAKSALEQVREKYAKQEASLQAEQSKAHAEIQRLEAERKAASSSISETDLALYEQLRKQRRGLAVAVVVDKACSACGSTLSAAQLHAARSPNQLTRCDTCGRILYGG